VVSADSANPALRRLRQEGYKFQASLSYIERLCKTKRNNHKSMGGVQRTEETQ
jgi:hypothetical protein